MHAKPPPPPVHNDKDALHDMSSQIKAFVIFLVAFIALFLYSKSSVGVTFAHQLLKKIDLDKYLVSTSDTDTVSLAMVEEKLEPDSTPQRFLFVGDSMVEPMAYRFFDICRVSGDTMYAVTWYGSTTLGWSGLTLDYYIEETDPTYVIFCMGSNELSSKNLSAINESLRKMKAKVGDRPCIFIGPPNTKPDAGLNAEIAKVFGKKAYFDSQHLEMERRSDHLHPTSLGAREWMDLVAEWMNSDDCVHPVVLTIPDCKQSYNIEHIEVMQVKDKGRRPKTPIVLPQA